MRQFLCWSFREAKTALALGRRTGLALDVDIDARIAQTREPGAIRTSTLQDLDAGRRLELDTILSGLVAFQSRT